MATGDNILTAISVARECNIIKTTSEVFLADVKKIGNKDFVYWKSIQTGNKDLEPEKFFKDLDSFD